MRLFYALLPEKTCRETLWQAGGALRQRGVRGSFPPAENLHLTLLFLGESDRVRDAAACLRGISAPAFTAVFEGLGRFRQREGELWWVGAAPAAPMQALNRQLKEGLRAAGFAFDTKPFKAHLTLARRVTLPPGERFEALAGLVPRCESGIAAVRLMRSDRVQGRMVYTEVARRELGPPAGVRP